MTNNCWDGNWGDFMRDMVLFNGRFVRHVSETLVRCRGLLRETRNVAMNTATVLIIH